MIEIEKPKIEAVEVSKTYGKFVVEPLERGYATTLGNSLRRVLLSSLPGAAVTSVKIEGVLHQFATIEGVREDVTDIILNLKQLLVKMHSDEPETVRIEVDQEGDVTTENIVCPADVEILNNPPASALPRRAICGQGCGPSSCPPQSSGSALRWC